MYMLSWSHNYDCKKSVFRGLCRDKVCKTLYLLKLKEMGGLDPYETTIRSELQDDLGIWLATTSIHVGMYL